ncbi:hypothetical protein CEXT_601491 [Caerostris extrusa]|uniref:Uncharacterized protein n=1 Tax=Caerostris extrusa TaxID=172846 RepID=A0AAV4QH66_CAEEX|nr:hypothetical protein CEXT_601491 [Caerostris extrusa]
MVPTIIDLHTSVFPNDKEMFNRWEIAHRKHDKERMACHHYKKGKERPLEGTVERLPPRKRIKKDLPFHEDPGSSIGHGRFVEELLSRIVATLQRREVYVLGMQPRVECFIAK